MSNAPHRPTAPQSGLYCTPVHVDAVRHSLGSELAWLEVDLARVGNKSELMEAFARLGLPEHFGRNWDALADMLTDLSWQPAHGYVLRLAHGADAARALGSDWATLLEVLKHVADTWKSAGTPFIVLVDDAAELALWI